MIKRVDVGQTLWALVRIADAEGLLHLVDDLDRVGKLAREQHPRRAVLLAQEYVAVYEEARTIASLVPTSRVSRRRLQLSVALTRRAYDACQIAAQSAAARGSGGAS